MLLVRPTTEHLPAYIAALQRGWSPDTIRKEAAVLEELARIAADPVDFLVWMEDIEAKGPPVTLADGRQVPRVPGLRRWIWDERPGVAAEERFIGSINLRWGPGGGPLPPHVLGHIGYSVAEWHAGRGHATRALTLLLDIARAQRLASADLTTDPANLASQRVITRNGGWLVETFDKGPTYGNKPGLRFRILL